MTKARTTSPTTTSPATTPPATTLPATRRTVVAVATSIAAMLLVASPARAQPASPEDWPCVQVLVPDILPSVLWPVPIDATLADTWRENPEIRVLAQRLGELEQVDPSALEAMDAYAESVPEPRRRGELTRLADGVVSVANTRRASYLDGIRRYTRQQIAIASQIESTLNELADLDDAAGGSRVGAGSATGAAVGAAGGEDIVTSDAGSVNGVARAEVEETLAWHERLYDQRERSIRALCERPVELEETLSEVLRELAYRLPDA